MRFTIEDGGTEYEDCLEDMTLEEAIAIQKESGLTIGQIRPGLRIMDANAIGVLVWLGKMRAGEACRWKDLLPLVKPMQVKLVPESDESAEGEPKPSASAKVPADPTRSGGRTRKARTTAT